MAREEQAPYTVCYPRDPTLDPQLVWKGKEEQDSQDLEVPAVPIYIQEKIHPQAIIEDLRRHVGSQGTAGQTRSAAEELSLFDDFNGMEDFEQKVDFYHHEGHWTNRMILGDSLLVMNSLVEKEGLKGRVQMIYIDPPYGIKFGSNWQVSTRKRQVADKFEDATRQPEQVRAFRDTWKLGIHSYLAYLRDRLVLARELLTETGSVFVQIGDENVHLARCLMDEVFGSDNVVSQITFRTTTGRGEDYLSSASNFILWYAKEPGELKYRALYNAKEVGGRGADVYSLVRLPGGDYRRATQHEKDGTCGLPDGGRLFQPDNLTSQRPMQGNDVRSFEYQGRTFYPGKGVFKTDLCGLTSLARAGRLWPTRDGTLRYVRFLDDFPAMPISNVWTDTGTGSFTDAKVYVVQTASKVVERCVLMATDPGDLVFDPTCGSGTTAYVAEQWGRRWITVDTSRVALALARTRLMSARYPYYLLADSPGGQKKEAQVTGKAGPAVATNDDVRKGFVYERVPHVTLKSIANNPDIREGMTRQEIDGAIQRHAETALLVDRPYQDSKRIRVCGPFTVESLAPHRVLATNPDTPRGEAEARADADGRQYEPMILDNLRKAGVQNARRNERLRFDTLEPYAGAWLHARGTYTDASGEQRRVAISIGPEFGTVGPDWMREAAKEAVRGVGFDLLIVCGFSFDGYASEEARKLGPLTVIPVRMNNDLSMGEHLLKRAGAGNLFMAFGEPDIRIDESEADVTVRISGLDVYDPTTGQIRSGSTDDLAVWFIDTDYDGESFFVRHAYFTGDSDPYEKLRRALNAQIDADAWASLYRTTSRPFPKPSTGKIAVKVINHDGDEVLKVYEVA